MQVGMFLNVTGANSIRVYAYNKNQERIVYEKALNHLVRPITASKS